VRYVVYGAGAVGASIGAALFMDSHEVIFIARGGHLDALREQGLRFGTGGGEHVLRIPAVGSPAEVDLGPGTVVLLATKAQDTATALSTLAAVAPPALPVVCAQNGVENERLAARAFGHAYAMCVILPATHLEPGVVRANSWPTIGVLDVGRYPAGVDELAVAVAADLEASRFSSRPEPTIMRWKYAKLLANLGNAIQAACGGGGFGRGSDLYRRARAEGVSCLRAARIDFASEAEDRTRRADHIQLQTGAGGAASGTAAGSRSRRGGSSWQSLARGTGTIETDYLNGEIVLLGRLHAVPTPVNAMLCRVARRLAAERRPPGSLTLEDLERELAAEQVGSDTPPRPAQVLRRG